MKSYIRETLRVALLLWCVCLAASPIAARADASELPHCTDQPDDAEVSARLGWIERRLAAGTPYAASWWGGWLAFATAEGIWGWVKFAQTHDRLDRDTWLVTGVGSALWVPQMLLWPMRSAYAVRGVRRLPKDTPEERLRSLAKAEQLLTRAADAESESISWVEHTLDTAWTVGSTAYIFGRSWRKGDSSRVHRRVIRVSVVELVLSEAVTEANILSTPRKAIRDHDHYRDAGCGLTQKERLRLTPAEPRVRWKFLFSGSQLGVTARF